MELILAGRLQYCETIAKGIENASAAFIGMLQGDNTGKQLGRLAQVATSAGRGEKAVK